MRVGGPVNAIKGGVLLGSLCGFTFRALFAKKFDTRQTCDRPVSGIECTDASRPSGVGCTETAFSFPGVVIGDRKRGPIAKPADHT